MTMDKKELKASKTEKAVLDSYFSIRECNGVEGVTMVAERKTTIDIQDDLRPTLLIGDDVIVDYMLQHGFVLKPDEDGSVVWNIYRMR